MKPILLIHGYSSEGKDNTAKQIYGTLPNELKKRFGPGIVRDINLSRWISLNDGIALDDVSFAMERALREEHADLFDSGFHIVIHSTGALVVRNWIQKFSPKPSPVNNLIHLAGANFGSGLAHIGRGQLARWGRLIFGGTGRGVQILNELEFGAWKTLDTHLHYLQPGNDMHRDYEVQEFCIAGSQTLAPLRAIPIRYVKEDSSDNTVRTSGCNLNFNYIPVTPKPKTLKLKPRTLANLVNKRMDNKQISDAYYQYDLQYLSGHRPEVPFAVAYETAHFGGDIGIVSGKKNRAAVMPLVKTALNTPYSATAYQKSVERFQKANQKTFERAAKLKSNLLEWDKQAQYEGHAQLIFRIRDQFGNAVKHFDINIHSDRKNREQRPLEKMVEDHHGNKQDGGTITFYLRTQQFNRRSKTWRDLLQDVAPVDIEITGHEPLSGDIRYVPLSLRLGSAEIQHMLQSFRTTIIDITLARLPSEQVFKIS